MLGDFVMTDADHFEFNGNGVSIEYIPMGAGAVPHLTYQDAHRKLQLSGDEIRKDSGGLRGALTIDLERRIGLNTDTFTLFVPEVHVADGQRAKVTTVGITTETLGGALPDVLPLPIDHFTAIQLDGFAEKRTGILPLSDA
jgi:hypothetical protein